MAVTQNLVTVDQGSDSTHDFYWDSHDGTNDTAAMDVRTSTGTLLFSLSSPSTGIAIAANVTDPNTSTTGSTRYRVTISHTNSALLTSASAGAYVYDLKVTGSDGTVTYLFAGIVPVRLKVTT